MALIHSGKIPANPYDVIGVNKEASWLLSRIYWKYVLLKIKYIFLRDSYACPRWIFIFDSDQAQINSVNENQPFILDFHWPFVCSVQNMYSTYVSAAGLLYRGVCKGF